MMIDEWQGLIKEIQMVIRDFPKLLFTKLIYLILKVHS